MAEATGLRYTTRVLEGGLSLGITLSQVPRMASAEALAQLLIDELKRRNIVFGLDEPAILDLMHNRTLAEEVIIATGKPARRGGDAEIELVRVPPSFAAQIGASDRIDFKEIENVSQVKEGDLISRKIAADPGEPGFNIFGKEMRPPPVRDAHHPRGRNMTISVDGLEMRAAKDGFLRWRDQLIDVVEVYVVDGDLDMSVGNVRYQGEVQVRGNVQSGLEVVAGGDVRVGGSVDRASITSEGGTVSVQGPVIGSSERLASVSALGDIQIDGARFARIESRSGDIVARHALEHSEIKAAGNLVLHSGPAMNCVVEVGGAVDVARVTAQADTVNPSDIESIAAAAGRASNREPRGFRGLVARMFGLAEAQPGVTPAPTHNRRGYVRVPVTEPVTVQLLRDPSTLSTEAALVEISAGGARIRLRDRLRDAERFQIQFKLPEVDGTMWMEAQVVRLAAPPAERDPNRSYGVQFTKVEPAVRERLARFCLAEDLRQQTGRGRNAPH